MAQLQHPETNLSASRQVGGKAAQAKALELALVRWKAPGKGTSVCEEASKHSRGAQLLLRAWKFQKAAGRAPVPSGDAFLAARPPKDAYERSLAALAQWDVARERAPSATIRVWRLQRGGSCWAEIGEDGQLLHHAVGADPQGARSRGQKIPFEDLQASSRAASRQASHQRTRTPASPTRRRSPSPPHKRAAPPGVNGRGGGRPAQLGRGPAHGQHLVSPTKKRPRGQLPAGADPTGKRIIGPPPPLHRTRLRCTAPPGLGPLAWGWAGEYRLGTGFDAAALFPERLHPSVKGRRIISVAAGRRHSAIVSDEGLVFCVGEAQGWQLGTTSALAPASRPPPSQRMPLQVRPSGLLKRGRDFTVAQVAAGDTCTYSREANGADAAAVVEGLAALAQELGRLREDCPQSHTLQRLAAHMREELATLSRRYEGQVLAWGSGAHGELGLGRHVTEMLNPRPLAGLSGKPVSSISAGKGHVLALTLAGEVFAWGRGKDGRLGLGDFEDRWAPTAVMGLAGRGATTVAAGAAHSLAVTGKKDVYTWGRGAHGRLGLGDNRNRNSPCPVQQWPPRPSGGEVQQAALGGGHTMVLICGGAPATEHSPGGKEARTVVYAWGYGANGQLGVGDWRPHSSSPVRVIFPAWVRVASISAGKRQSLATTQDGELYAWGKAWYGELGTGKAVDFHAAPTKVEYPGSARHLFVAAVAGERHSLGLAISIPPVRGWAVQRRREQIQAVHGGLARAESGLLVAWRCPRRGPWAGRGPNPEPMLACMTCALTCICTKCASVCHRGHNISPCILERRVLCQCGIRLDVPGDCGKSPGEDAAEQRARTPQSRCRLLLSVDDEDPGPLGVQRVQAAEHAQRLARGWLGRRIVRQLRAQHLHTRQEACRLAWQIGVMNVIQRGVDQLRRRIVAQAEVSRMALGDWEARLYNYHLRLQPCLQAMSLQREALLMMCTSNGVIIPTAESQLDPRVTKGFAELVEVTLWSRRELRQHQRMLPPHMRMPASDLLDMTYHLPTGYDGQRGGGTLPDMDLNALARSVAPGRPTRAAELAAPEGLYQRVVCLRGMQARRLHSRRRLSFSLEGCQRVDKGVSPYDRRWAQQMDGVWQGADESLTLTRPLQLGRRKLERLSSPAVLRTTRGAHAYAKFLLSHAPGSTDPDVAQLAGGRMRRGGSHQRARSVCAPERANASKVTWLRRVDAVKKVLRAGARRRYPTVTEGPEWGLRAGEWGLLAAKAPPQVTVAELKLASRRIAKRGRRCGMDLATKKQKEELVAGTEDGDSDGHEAASETVDTQGRPQSAKRAGTPALPEGWAQYADDAGNRYYYNAVTGESTWDRPTRRSTAGGLHTAPSHLNPFQQPLDSRAGSQGLAYAQTATAGAAGSGTEWQQYQDPASGFWYWYNSFTGESRWT